MCMKLATCALNWPMGMVGAGANFFKFLVPMGLMLDKLRSFTCVACP